MVESCYKIPRVSTVIHPEGLARDFRQCPYLPGSLQVPLDLLGHMAQMVEHPVQQPGLVGTHSLTQSLTQSQQVSESLGIWAGGIHPNEEFVTFRIQSGPLN